MYYAPLFIILGLIILAIIGYFHCSIRIYNGLENGQKVYSKMNPSYDDYNGVTIRVDPDGTKYTLDKDGDAQFPISQWDVLTKRIITEEEYLNMVD